MSVARSVAEVLRDHVVLEVEAIDRMYLNVYVPSSSVLPFAWIATSITPPAERCLRPPAASRPPSWLPCGTRDRTASPVAPSPPTSPPRAGQSQSSRRGPPSSANRPAPVAGSATGEIPSAFADLDPTRRQREMLRARRPRQAPRTLFDNFRNQTRSITRVGDEVLAYAICVVLGISRRRGAACAPCEELSMNGSILIRPLARRVRLEQSTDRRALQKSPLATFRADARRQSRPRLVPDPGNGARAARTLEKADAMSAAPCPE